MERNLTSGSVLKNLVYFSLPYLLSYFLQTLYGMADLFIIGQYNGVESTTAVAIGSQVMHMLTVMIVGLAMGATVTIGKTVGAGDREGTSVVVGNTVTLFMAVSVIVTALLLAFLHSIVQVMSTPIAAVPGTNQYLKICFIGIPFITAYNIISAIFRGMGDSKTPMYIVIIACIANIGLDYLFIGGLDFGPAGAALGTTFAQAISVFSALAIILKKNRNFNLHKEHFKPRREIIRQILKIGVPVAVQDGFIQISFIVITIIANGRGLNDAAAVGIVEKIVGVLFLLPSSMLSAISAISAQNIGAGKADRAVSTLWYGIGITAGFGIVIAIIIQFISEPTVGLFMKEKELQVIILGGEYLRAYVWDCVFAGIHFCFGGFFCAFGLSSVSFIHSAISIVTVRIPGAYLASKFFPSSLFPMGLAAPCGSLLSAVICVIVYCFLRRKQRKLMLSKS